MAPSQLLSDNPQDPSKQTPKQTSRPGARYEDEHDHQLFRDQTIQSPPVVPSPRLLGGPLRQGLPGAVERAPDYSKTALYGHHRQTSIVHGIQHSRNGSQSSMSTSPVTPQLIAAAGVGLERLDLQPVATRLDTEVDLPSRPGTSLAGPTLSPVSSIPMERSASAADDFFWASGQRAVELVYGKPRREHPAHPSYSLTLNDDQNTVGEYALHVLFTSFIAQAEEKLSRTITVPFDPEPQIERICGPGRDATFDQLLAALGHIASPKPKALIDSIMLWRKSKSDAASDARAELYQMRVNPPGGPGGALSRRNTEPVQTGQDSEAADAADSGPATLSAKQDYVAEQERLSTVSIYVLCRVLLEIISQCSLESITLEMEEKLEGIIFGQLKIADIDQLLSSQLKLSNWNLFAEILGCMSGINFPGVARRFLEDLDSSLQEMSAKSPTSPATREAEGKMELVLGGMKHLKVKISPEYTWEMSCEFLVSLGRLFSRAHGQRVKFAFCQTFDLLLRPIAANASNSHLLHPKWYEVVVAIRERLAQMSVKPRHWSVTFPLTATLLCVSSPDSFSSQWLPLILSAQVKLKDRNTRPLCLQVISRLVWSYLYRTSDNFQTSARKLDDVMRLVLPSGKRSITASDIAVTDPLIQIIRIIGFKYPEYCFRTVIFPLMNAELFVTEKELRVEQLDPDRIVVGIRAFLCIMSDLEKGEQGRPPFPRGNDTLPPSEERWLAFPIFALPTTDDAVSKTASGLKQESVSRPVLTHVLSDGARDYYLQFCQILGKITTVCNDTFGGQAALDEKFNSPGPKTPISDTFSFSRRDEHSNASDQKQAFYELLHVAVQALPRCLPADISSTPLIHLLCTGTAHVQSNIAHSSACSLKAIARQSHAQQVVAGFSRFIFDFEGRYSEMSGGRMLGPGHIDNTLRLYVELLHIWLDEIKHEVREAENDKSDTAETAKRAKGLTSSCRWAEVDQAEAYGLFFLCSQSRRVRHFAITVLRLIVDFDKVLTKTAAKRKAPVRLIDIIEGESEQIMKFDDEQLSVAERSRLQRGLQNANVKSAVVELCTSDVSYDASLWFKIFPNLISIASERCPLAVAICRDLICSRLLQMYKHIVFMSEPTRGLYYNPDANNRTGSRSPGQQPEVTVEQWKLYLIFACATFSDSETPPPDVTASDAHHANSGPKLEQPIEKILTARMLFKTLISLLSVSSASVRDAIVVSLGCINIGIYRILLEELQGQVSRCIDEARAKPLHQRTNSVPRRNRKMDLLRTEISHVFKLTSHFLEDPLVYESDFFLNSLTSYAKDLKLFLMDGEVQMDWEFQKLRRYYCGLMEALFEGINRTKDPSRWMTFESRKSAFSLMEDWCGFSPNQNQIRAREDTMRQSLIDQQSLGERGVATAAMEIEKRNLRTAALSAMASLCAGPVSITTESGATLQFDVRRMLTWLEAIFNSGSDKMNVIGQRGLRNIVSHNQEHPHILENCIARCYLSEVPKVSESYFSVTAEVLQKYPNYPCPFWKSLALCLFMLGNKQSDIRSKSSTVLRHLEMRQQRNSKIQDFDISISDKTQAVYKLAQFEISKRLAKQYPEQAFYIFSEFTGYFKDLPPVAQRNVVAVILPWIQTIELKVDPNGGPTAQSYVLLANLLELTIKFGGTLHIEVQALWQALATGPHAGNVRLILDFVMQLCFERREQNFVEYAKQIVVFLSTTNSTPGSKVVEFLLMQINPKAMVPNEKGESIPPPSDTHHFPYCADLGEALPVGTKQAGFSLGQLSLILLVDLMVSPVHLTPDSVPLLLQVVTALWDHYTPLVQDQAREMLVHMIHELVLSRMDDVAVGVPRAAIQQLVDAIRRHDRAVVWGYEDSNGKVQDRDNKVPTSMEHLTTEVVKTFQVTFPAIKEQWGRLSLTWATSCPVRHLACRSFQIFRCVLTSIDQYMLGDMLARLSNTVADDDPEIQSFSMEILTTLKTVLAKLETEKLISFPQLFWTTCACLESINEREFLEATGMLAELVGKLDFRSPNVRRIIADGRPDRWEGDFVGVQPLLYKGLRSSLCWQATLDTIDKLVRLPADPLIGDDSRLFFALLANFPRFVHGLANGNVGEATLKTARTLLSEADKMGLESIGLALDDFVSGRQQDSSEFINQLFMALKEHFLPQHDLKMVTFLIGLLTNSLSWVKVQTMRILCVAIPQVDMRNPEIAGYGSDLISPLLRLLQTEFCMNALEVLDNILTMSGSEMDKYHLRMSMTRLTSKEVRKEYERAQSLFGIPEGSGWAVPAPASKTDSTRANIHAAFYMCQSAEGSSTDATSTTGVEFHVDDFPYGYIDGDRADALFSDDGRGDGLVGDLVTKLDSLDDFFDEAPSPKTDDDGRSSRTVTEFSPESFETATDLYDAQILPILHQASSTKTFQNGFADRPMGKSRDIATNTMNPGAFTASMSFRMPIHSRSITSPSALASYQSRMTPEIGSDEEYVSGGFSDADDERSRMRIAMKSPISHSSRPHMNYRAGSSRSRDEGLREPTLPNVAPRKSSKTFYPVPRNPGDYS
ncbi:hypothetical protein E4U19_002288 [Claviceps sp. Clav32 group G5]|nr:hypothetical protein E4U19_002288 [Claviceps sp. Clav32 group G5]KAG6051642.1 hypothetical protein E4U39_000102 [Claviceps sp. Clav50 group G5]